MLYRIQAEAPEAAIDALEVAFYESEERPWSLVKPNVESPWILEGFFPSEREARAAYEALAAAHGLPGAPRVAELEDADWKEAYKHHIRSWTCGRLCWIPAWEMMSGPEREDAAVMSIDSGMAFGTGSHETTRLCARELVRFAEERGVGDHAILDAGCGSGILAISAAALGYTDVSGFDFDPEAVRVSEEQAAANGCATVCRFFVADLEAGLTDRTADLILGNIETPALRLHVAALLAAVRPGGRLVLSGILAEDAWQLTLPLEAAMPAHWPEDGCLRQERDGEWIAIVADRGRSLQNQEYVD